MNYRKNGVRLLGLLAVAALSLMALAAASAQAAAPGFLVGGKAVGETLKPAVTAEIDSPPSTLLVPGLNFEINCKSFTVNKGIINSNTDADGELSYTECTTLSISKLPEEIACEVKEPIVATGLIRPTELTNGDPAILAVGKALINLTKVGDLTKECILPFDNSVKGELCLKIAAGTNDTVKPLVSTNSTIQGECVALNKLEGTWANVITGKTHEEILAAEKTVPPTAFLDELKYGTQTVTIDGAATVSLSGAHAGLGLTLGVSLF